MLGSSPIRFCVKSVWEDRNGCLVTVVMVRKESPMASQTVVLFQNIAKFPVW